METSKKNLLILHITKEVAINKVKWKKRVCVADHKILG